MNKTYTTIQGDEWDMIAYKLYKDESMVNLILKANQQYKYIVIFPAGITLQVPEIGDNMVKSQNLPPWKR